MGEQKDHDNAEHDLQQSVREEDLFPPFYLLLTQFQPDRKHQKYDPELPDKIEWIVRRAIEAKKGTHDRPRRNIADDMWDTESL